MKPQDPFVKEYSKLIGKTVKNILIDHSDPTIGQVYGIEFTDGTMAWILCDPEGNGPGFLEIAGGK